MTRDEKNAELTSQAARLVQAGHVDARNITVNRDAGTISHRWTGELLHYESGVTVVWAPWRPQYWSNA